ncbi:uncharacterized protein LOC142336882 [Convolutriloba macropyga]|uniref:uncharacterized protein LOC142336882 n=1 Tax=Convolutriloba macropyga TaxID=536237 RepID=UPI003F5205B2
MLSDNAVINFLITPAVLLWGVLWTLVEWNSYIENLMSFFGNLKQFFYWVTGRANEEALKKAYDELSLPEGLSDTNVIDQRYKTVVLAHQPDTRGIFERFLLPNSRQIDPNYTSQKTQELANAREIILQNVHRRK